MTTSLAPRRRRHAVVVAAGLALATIASAFGATPAGAAAAPLTTTDGIGIRVDENAIVGPALEAIETALQPFVNTKISQGAVANSVMDDPDWADGSANLELSIDFINAGTVGYPQGGIKVRGDLLDIRMRFYRYGAWWQPECLIYVEPDDGYIDASAKIDTTKLPNAPITVNPINAVWDNSPSAGPAPGYSWTCNGYLIDEWWDGLWGNGTDVAAQLEAELNGEAQDLINSLWTDHVAPVINSLNEFGITFSQVKTDNNGLVVKANVNATNGITIPNLGGPFNVSTAEDAGVTSNVDNLLAARSEVTATIHPNVVNQFMSALNQAFFNNFASPPVNGPAVESYLLPLAARSAYDDNGWSVSLTTSNGFFTKPTGAGGRPQVQMPQTNFAFYNTDYVFGVIPIAVFNADVNTSNLNTEVRPSGKFGPYISSTNTTIANGTLDTIQSLPDVVTHNPSPSGLLTHAKAAIDLYSDNFLTDFVSLAPISVGGVSVTLCSACTRFSGDQRYTEYFNVG
jgi:hypothetical protein